MLVFLGFPVVVVVVGVAVDVAILAVVVIVTAAAHSVIGDDSGDIVIPSPSTDFDSGGILVLLQYWLQ